MADVRERLLLLAANSRHGLVPAPQPVPQSPTEPAGFFNVGVPHGRPGSGWQSASGGAAWAERDAKLAAVGEAVERYAASTPLEEREESELQGESLRRLEDYSLFSAEQRRNPAFPLSAALAEPRKYVRARPLDQSATVWVPSGLVRMVRGDGSQLASSNGLALGLSPEHALVRGVQELVERDALTTTWLHSLPGRELTVPTTWWERLDGLQADVHLLDLTPAYSPWPVAAVLGSTARRGRPCYSLGAACRAGWSEAAEKALLEWLQGTAFVPYYLREHPDLAYAGPHDVHTFDDHAVYYSVRPRDWEHIPLLHSRSISAPVTPGSEGLSWEAQAQQASEWTAASRIRVDLVVFRPPDLVQLGLWVVKALSPDLVPVFCEQSLPHLGGTCADLSWRYPDLAHLSRFPNPLPHPLG